MIKMQFCDIVFQIRRGPKANLKSSFTEFCLFLLCLGTIATTCPYNKSEAAKTQKGIIITLFQHDPNKPKVTRLNLY